MCIGGALVLLKSVLNPDKAEPTGLYYFFDMIMLGLLQTSGVERSADEYKALLESEGFGDFQFHAIQTSSQFDVIVARKHKAQSLTIFLLQIFINKLSCDMCLI